MPVPCPEHNDKADDIYGHPFPTRTAGGDGKKNRDPSGHADKWKVIRISGELRVYGHVSDERERENQSDDADTHPIDMRVFVGVLQNGRILVLLNRGGD